MTIARENGVEYTVWVACCDKCGDRFELDTGSDDIDDVIDEARRQGLKVIPDRHKFEGGRSGYTENYQIVTCGDCQ
jgi:aryl-phospho-beta-D-glucosidase BglC (GH1 family)